MIELRRLRYLVVLANRLSYSRAANELGCPNRRSPDRFSRSKAKPALRLFDRDQASVRFTEQGRWMVEQAEALLINASDSPGELERYRKGSEGCVR